MRSLLTVAAFTLAAATLPAQAAPATATPAALRATATTRPAPPPPLVTREDTLRAISEMRASLRMLVTAQEGHWAQRGTYTTDMMSLGFANRRGSESAHAQVLFAGSRGWTALSTHRALKGMTCVMYVGIPEEMPVKLPTTRRDGRVAEEEGAPTCDALPTSASTDGGYNFDVAARVIQQDSAAQALVARIRADLSALRAAQDAYFAAHQTYAATIEALGDFRVVSGASIVLRSATANGWTAEAMHKALPESALRATATRK